jgi:hypothetical protein
LWQPLNESHSRYIHNDRIAGGIHKLNGWWHWYKCKPKKIKEWFVDATYAQGGPCATWEQAREELRNAR